MITQGSRFVAWAEANLVHGEGDYHGQPFRLSTWQKVLIYKIYEIEADPDSPTGWRRVTNRALIGFGKGNGKTELLAAIGLYELLADDPLIHVGTPAIVVAAVSYDNANELFSAAKLMVAGGPLADYVESFETLIERKDKPGWLRRVAAVGGANDGKKPTVVICDELHEWNRPKVHTILTNGLAKRFNSLELNITTAGVKGSDSLCEQMYLYGKKCASGEIDNPRFLFEWAEATAEQLEHLDDEPTLVAALRLANPASDDRFFQLAELVQKWQDKRIPTWQYLRYHLNVWTAADPDQWISSAILEGLEVIEGSPSGEIGAGFDGSYRRDCTAICYAHELEDGRWRVGVWGAWERNESHPEDWTVPREEVHAYVQELHEQTTVKRMLCDTPGWHTEIDEWAGAYGEGIEHFNTGTKEFIAAASELFRLAHEGLLVLDGTPSLARHLANCRPKETRAGILPTKASKTSPLKIDIAIAAINALAAAMAPEIEAEPEFRVRYV